MKSNQEFKNLALADLEGNWAKFAIATLLLFFISGGVGAAFDIFFYQGTSNLWSLLCLPLTWGYDVLFLRLIRKEHSNVERMFDGYKDFVRVFLLVLLKSIAVLIGFCLFIVPGIILALGFAMSDYILADDKEISSYDALKESWSLMKSHKTQLFWLSLSFIGWIILSFLTLGIGFLFLCPYMETTLAHFYEELKTDSII